MESYGTFGQRRGINGINVTESILSPDEEQITRSQVRKQGNQEVLMIIQMRDYTGLESYNGKDEKQFLNMC